VEECFYANGSRYTQVFFNAHNPGLNSFKKIDCPEELIAEIEARHLNLDHCPMLFANGVFSPMIKPSVYFALLKFSSLIEELEVELARKNIGARGITCIGGAGSSLSA